ncbi:MAG: hypothetical protein WC581_00390 [Thermodesulfovibrionales bacterium]
MPKFHQRLATQQLPEVNMPSQNELFNNFDFCPMSAGVVRGIGSSKKQAIDLFKVENKRQRLGLPLLHIKV